MCDFAEIAAAHLGVFLGPGAQLQTSAARHAIAAQIPFVRSYDFQRWTQATLAVIQTAQAHHLDQAVMGRLVEVMLDQGRARFGRYHLLSVDDAAVGASR